MRRWPNTGGSSGFGRAIVQAAREWNIAVAGTLRDADKLDVFTVPGFGRAHAARRCEAFARESALPGGRVTLLKPESLRTGLPAARRQSGSAGFPAAAPVDGVLQRSTEPPWRQAGLACGRLAAWASTILGMDFPHD